MPALTLLPVCFVFFEEKLMELNSVDLAGFFLVAASLIFVVGLFAFFHQNRTLLNKYKYKRKGK